MHSLLSIPIYVKHGPKAEADEWPRHTGSGLQSVASPSSTSKKFASVSVHRSYSPPATLMMSIHKYSKSADRVSGVVQLLTKTSFEVRICF